MARLIDDIRNTRGFEAPTWVPDKSMDVFTEQVKQAMAVIDQPDLPILELSNVAEYFFNGTDQEQWNASHFPNCAPPYETFWAEYRMPSHLRSETYGELDVSARIKPGRIAVIMNYTPLEEGGWKLLAVPFMEVPHSHPVVIMGPLNEWHTTISADGILAEGYRVVTITPEAETEARSFVTLMHPVFLGVSFMHCKNVIVTDNVAEKKFAKRYQERHGRMPAPYQTLVIEPLKQILRHEGKSDQVGVARAMHICRGHFKDYRIGKGLFGKYKKLVWQPSLVRGSHGAAPPREVKIKL